MADSRERAASVLVVEDDPSLAGLISLVLNRSGYVAQVATCHGAADAVERNRPAVVIIDLQMKRAGELCLALRSGTVTRPIPILALVAPLPGPVEQRTRQHVDACLAKPFELRRLIDTVHRLAAHSDSEVGSKRLDHE